MKGHIRRPCLAALGAFLLLLSHSVCCKPHPKSLPVAASKPLPGAVDSSFGNSQASSTGNEAPPCKRGDIRKRVEDAVRLIHSYGGTDTFLKVSNIPVRYPYPMFLCDHCGRQCDLCRMIDRNVFFAPIETALFDYLLRGGCMGTNGPMGAEVIDVGANIGYFTMLAANYGCDVKAFEPHELNRALLEASLALNQVEGLVDVYPVALGNGTAGQQLTLKGYGAFATLEPNGTDVKPKNLGLDEARPQANVRLEMLSDYVGDREVLLLKIDTEGYEGHVLEGSWPAWEKVRLHNVLVEVKYFKTQAKLDLLRKLMVSAGLKYAYTYKEDYHSRHSELGTVPLEGRLLEVSDMLLKGDANDNDIRQLYEDFLLRREPMPGRYVVYTRVYYGAPWMWVAVLLLLSAPVAVYVAFTADFCTRRMWQTRNTRLQQFRTSSD